MEPDRETTTILVVDDDDVVRDVIERGLDGTGLQILTAASASEALAAAADARIDLLVADLSLREMSGPALAAKLQVENPVLRVLYVSGWPDLDAFPEVTEGQLLTKPFTFEELRQAVARALGSDPGVAPRRAGLL